MKKIFAICLAAVMVMSMVTGCGSKTSAPAEAEAPKIEEKAEATEIAEAAPADATTEEGSGEVAEILFWTMMFGSADLYEPTVQKLVDQFNEEHPDIHVNVQFHTWANYYQEYLTSITSGNAPDVSDGYFTMACDYARMGEILDLSSIVDEWKESGFIDEFPAGSLELHTFEGKQVGIPWNSDPREIIYNKEIFEQAGITELPTNWEEFKEVCRTIKEKTDVIPVAFGGGCNFNDAETRMLLFGNNAGITDKDGNATFDSVEVQETLKFYGDLLDEGLMDPGSAGYQNTDVAQMFANGKVAIAFHNTDTSLMTDDFIEKVGVMPNLSAKAGQEARGLTYCNPMEAFSQTKYPEQCKTFIKWYVEHSLPLFTEGGVTTFPVLKSQLADAYYSDNPFLKQVIDNVLPTAATASWPYEGIPASYGQVEGEGYVGLACQEVLAGGRDYEAIANKYNEQIAAAIAEAE